MARCGIITEEGLARHVNERVGLFNDADDKDKGLWIGILRVRLNSKFVVNRRNPNYADPFGKYRIVYPGSVVRLQVGRKGYRDWCYQPN